MSEEDDPLDPTMAAVIDRAARARGMDLRGFRTTSLRRRVEARMSALAIDDPAVYRARVEKDDAEANTLAGLLLVTTTALFREPDTFTVLRGGALAELARERALQGAKLLRAWVVACSTGEEAVSFAMCMVEAIEGAGVDLEPFVLGTDVSNDCIDAARSGVVRTDPEPVPPELARRFLARTPRRVAVAAALTRFVRFTVHDALHGIAAVPPAGVVASFDVVSCRNLLIYLTPPAQEELLTRLLKATAPDALLVLGRTERPPPSIEGELELLDPTAPVYRVRRR